MLGEGCGLLSELGRWGDGDGSGRAEAGHSSLNLGDEQPHRLKNRTNNTLSSLAAAREAAFISILSDPPARTGSEIV